ncbi:MAG: hypothetical protein H0V62_00770 [Gammaproteobacteria bacterium]|nr:hypothetical protein [Gammaproteobacteria bacterium]MBA3730975.1 hypothetical protein [Gammaproteobacteria bacterium]
MSERLSRPIGMIFNGVWSQYAVATAPKYREFIELIYVRDLGRARIERFDALIVPFQNDHAAIAIHRNALYAFLAAGKKIAVFGDSAHWIDAQWEDRPVNNYWWADDPTRPPIANTSFDHPLFSGLTPRQACWHVHGVYTGIPKGAEVLQSNHEGEVIAWQTKDYGGVLFAATSDPIVEHGVQQIQHLDHFVDNLIAWLCGRRPPPDKLTVDPAAYGRPFQRAG